MKHTVPCPRCHAELDPAAELCRKCMRPRDRAEILRGVLDLQQAPLRRRRAVLSGALLAGLVSVGGLLFWFQRAELGGACRSSWSFALEWLGLEEHFHSRSQAQAPASRPAEPSSLVSAPAAAAPAAPAAARPAGAKPARPDYWLVRGLVYDLYSLKPVSGAQLSFVSRANGEELLALTDHTGHYSLKAARLSSGGYDVAVRHPRYQDNYLDENDPPYRTLSLERRHYAGSLFLQSQVLHVPFLPPFDEDRPWLDLVLMPR
ncbi:MAG: carboxypeptidase-like regulatory domain-containing protein [Elusimicrobia bacterium]|nr:carboxypeptidase-like regulatory domain-containing protein [Elusimicrobiota bacterium]